MRASEIEDYYGPYGRRLEQFYIQQVNANCVPGTFGCDVGSHRGTLESAIEQAKSFYSSSQIRMKIVNPEGKALAYYP